MAGLFYHTSVLDIEVNPYIPWAGSKAVPGRYSPVPHNDFDVGRPTIEELHRIFAEELDKVFDGGTSHFDHERFEDTEEKGNTNQRLVRLQHGAQ